MAFPQRRTRSCASAFSPVRHHSIFRQGAYATLSPHRRSTSLVARGLSRSLRESASLAPQCQVQAWTAKEASFHRLHEYNLQRADKIPSTAMPLSPCPSRCRMRALA